MRRDFIDLSRRYGADPEAVLAGGGNTSCKEDGLLFVKASGRRLAAVDEHGFVALSLSRLDEIWEKAYPADPKIREAEVLSDLLSARRDGETARPSVEALLHGLLPQPLIVHLHPSLINGLTCAREGEFHARRIFGERVLWVPSVNPGYILAKTVRDLLCGYRKRTGSEPAAILLENHGVCIGGEEAGDIDETYRMLTSTIEAELVRRPDMSLREPGSRSTAVSAALRQLFPEVSVYWMMNGELASRLSSAETFVPTGSSFTPDHIVYSGFKPLWISAEQLEGDDDAAVKAVGAAVKRFSREYGTEPKIIAAEGTGCAALSADARDLFLDTVRIAAYTESFGGPKFMSEEQISFIRGWEAERFRAAVKH